MIILFLNTNIFSYSKKNFNYDKNGVVFGLGKARREWWYLAGCRLMNLKENTKVFGSWTRGSSKLSKTYIVECDKSLTAGNSIDRIRLNGFNKNQSFSQNIRADIKNYYKKQNCVMLGINGTSENTKIEIDHKDGRKTDMNVSDISTQKLSDFQPLCKAANDVKRQICKKFKETDKRWDAKNIKGNPYSFYAGNEYYYENLGCIGCYQYDPIEYRKESAKRISEESSKHTAEYIMNKLYPKE